MISIGPKIRKIRKIKDLSLENMAFELGITTSAYSKIEREECNISIKRLEEIARILEVEVIDFFREPTTTSVSDTANTPPATKNDVETMVKMIQELILEISFLRLNRQK